MEIENWVETRQNSSKLGRVETRQNCPVLRANETDITGVHA